jgi:hypothetical protein
VLLIALLEEHNVPPQEHYVPRVEPNTRTTHQSKGSKPTKNSKLENVIQMAENNVLKGKIKILLLVTLVLFVSLMCLAIAVGVLALK